MDGWMDGYTDRYTDGKIVLFVPVMRTSCTNARSEQFCNISCQQKVTYTSFFFRGNIINIHVFYSSLQTTYRFGKYPNEKIQGSRSAVEPSMITTQY
jgi:hypothetical protein